METIRRVIRYDEGYKTLTSKHIGRYAHVGYDLIKNTDLLPSYKLIYAYLRGYMHYQKKTTLMSLEMLSKKTSYSTRTIKNAIAKLVENDYLTVEQKKVSKDYNSTYMSLYSFKNDDPMFAMISNVFLESKLLSSKEKEFIILIFPYILPNDTIGSLEDPADTLWISNKTGLHRNTVIQRITSLRNKKLLSNHSTRYGYGEEKVKVGFYINLKKIMIDNANSIIEERNDLLTIVQDFGIKYEIKH